MSQRANNHPVAEAEELMAAEFSGNIGDLLPNPVVQSMDAYIHHGQVTCLEHSLSVAWHSYRVCRRLGFDAHAAARGALLHDLYLYDWHVPGSCVGLHGFSHPTTALRNARRHFRLNPREEDIIRKHMWPMTVVPPLHRESLVVCLVDKYCALIEVFSQRRKHRLLQFKQEQLRLQTSRTASANSPA